MRSGSEVGRDESPKEAGVTEKHCRGCARTHPVSAFHKNASSRDGLQNRCVDCLKEYRQGGARKRQCPKCDRSLTSRDFDPGRRHCRDCVTSAGAEHKTCDTCHRPRHRSDYYANPRSPGGVGTTCKACLSGTAREKYRAIAGARPYERAQGGMKTCRGCQRSLPVSEFGKRANGADGLQAQCKECQGDRRAAQKATNPERRRAVDRARDKRTGRHRRRTYNLTPDEWGQMIQQHDGRCAACGREAKRLVTDHCHPCGDVRGPLCDRCNIALHAIEDPDLLARLMKYADDHRKNCPEVPEESAEQ